MDGQVYYTYEVEGPGSVVLVSATAYGGRFYACFVETSDKARWYILREEGHPGRTQRPPHPLQRARPRARARTHAHTLTRALARARQAFELEPSKYRRLAASFQTLRKKNAELEERLTMAANS